MENNKALRRRQMARTTKLGSYTFAVCAILLAVIVVINLLVGLIPSKMTVFDTSANKLYTVSDASKKFLGKLSEDVTIHWVCQGGEEDETLSRFLDNYSETSSHLKMDVIDPVKNPTALDPYTSDTSDAPANYSIIVESARRYTVVDFFDMFYFYNQFLEENYGLGAVPYEMYQFYESYYQIFSYAESSGYVTDQLFYGDDTLTKAVEYVTLENIPHIYVLEGHGEDSFSQTFIAFATENNITFESLRLDTANAIPEDASCIVINSPEQDLSDSDTALIRSYLAAGGNIMLITGRTDTDHKNLLSLMSDYGMSAEAGIVYEGSLSGYKDQPYFLRPTANSTHEATSYASSYTIYMPNSHGITIADDAANVSALLTTTGSAYVMNGDVKSEAGQRVVAAAASKDTADGTTQIVWYASSDAFTDSVASTASYGNYYYLFYSLFWMNETYESNLATVEGPSINEPLLDGLTSSSVLIWSIIFVFVIPGIILTIGLIVWIRRKKH